jgi:hypothetical protein
LSSRVPSREVNTSTRWHMQCWRSAERRFTMIVGKLPAPGDSLPR